MTAPSHPEPRKPITGADVEFVGVPTEPVASLFEYVQRINDAGTSLAAHAARLGPEFFVIGPGRIEEWHVDAIVVGPTGIFLIWPIWSQAEKMLWETSELVRQHLTEQLGPNFFGAVEIVFYNPRVVDETRMDRYVYAGHGAILMFNILGATGDLAQLLTDWEPDDGRPRLPSAWIDQLRAESAPRWTLDGPDPQAEKRLLVGRSLHS
jgi:hypothetical protein